MAAAIYSNSEKNKKWSKHNMSPKLRLGDIIIPEFGKKKM